MQQNNGVSALFIASAYGHIEVVRELIAIGADIDMNMVDGASPRFAASQQEHIEVVGELILQGSEINMQKKLRRNLLYILSVSKDRLKLSENILQKVLR